MREKIIVLGIYQLYIVNLIAGTMGYFCVPVADLLLKPITSRSEKSCTYAHIAASPEKGQYACPRAHQGLFNERVEILQEVGDEVQIAISNCFYETPFSLEKQHFFWTLRSSIITDKELEKIGLSHDIFPEPICFDKVLPTDDVVTLLLPWHDTATGLIYSVGTRFKRYAAYDTPEGFGVIWYDQHTAHIRCATVPAGMSTAGYHTLSLDERQKIFVHILRLWVHHNKPQEAIAYVWGGTSWTRSCSDTFSLVHGEQFGQPVAFWIRPDLLSPCSGFDCSGLILRAAQIAGLPYFFKNTTTILHYLRPRSTRERLEEGDLIWCPGHVMVVSNLKDNLVIEARGYASGHGSVQEAKLEDRFQEIQSYDQLVEACRRHQVLTSQHGREPRRYQLLKLSSLWRQVV